MQIERREFLKLLGGLSGGVVLAGTGVDQFFEVPENLVEKIRTGPGIESWATTICGQCPGGCGIRVRLVDGIPVYVKGNPLHPINRGGVCPFAHGALELLFNPDRIKSPIERVGPVGFGRWEPLDWDEALDRITGKLALLRSEERSHQVAFLGSTEHGLLEEHIARFMRSFGSPNYYRVPGGGTEATAFKLATGQSRQPAPDVANARLVVSFGLNLFEEGPSPVYYTKLYSQLRDPANQLRPRFVQIGSRMGLTAANADRWIPIRPGTYGALALGVAHVLIRDEAFDTEFVSAHTFGFDSWTDRDGVTHIGYRDLVLKEYYPEKVAEVTGVPGATIVELAREIETSQPCAIIGGGGLADNSNGTYAQLAVNSLNALLGNFGREGGLVFHEPPPLAPLPPERLDELAIDAAAASPIVSNTDERLPITEYSTGDLFENLAEGRPYPIEVLFLLGGNPIFQLPGHENLRMALERIPLVISFDSFVNETSEFAHLVLPHHTFLERWDEISSVPTVAFAQVGIRQPVIEPVYDTRHVGDVLTELAQTLGGSVQATFQGASYEDLIKQRMEGVYESGEGAVASERVTDSWLEFLRQRGWHIGSYSSFSTFWDELLERGAWWNPVSAPFDPNSFFQTPSARYEFFVQNLRGRLSAIEPSTTFLSAQQDVAFLPHHEESAESQRSPLRLISFQLLSNRDGFGANQPSMQEIWGQQVHYFGQTWVEIHPLTAEEFGISNDEWIWIQTVVGSIRVRTKVHPGVVPGVVAVPFGLGHTSYGRYAKGRGENPHHIMRALYDPISKQPALQGTGATISRTA